MFFRKQKVAALSREQHNLETAFASAPVAFATEVLETLEDMIGICEGQYPRLFTSDKTSAHTGVINQFTLAIESVAFFLHAISRISFRRDDNFLRGGIVEPLEEILAQLFARIRSIPVVGDDPDSPLVAAIKREHLELFQEREIQYGSSHYLLGEEGDKKSALELAVAKISLKALEGRAFPIQPIVRLALLRGLETLDLPAKVEKLEVLMNQLR